MKPLTWSCSVSGVSADSRREGAATLFLEKHSIADRNVRRGRFFKRLQTLRSYSTDAVHKITKS